MQKKGQVLVLSLGRGYLRPPSNKFLFARGAPANNKLFGRGGCLEGVLRVSEKCLEGISRVSGGYLLDVRMVIC